MSTYRSATRKDLRGTGLVVGIACCVLGVLQILLHGKIPPVYLFSIGGVLIVLGLALPELLRPFHYLWMKFSLVLGWMMNRIILGVLFFVFFTFMALIIRLIGRDILHRDFHKRQDSYWVPKTEATPEPERYERQF